MGYLVAYIIGVVSGAWLHNYLEDRHGKAKR